MIKVRRRRGENFDNCRAVYVRRRKGVALSVCSHTVRSPLPHNNACSLFRMRSSIIRLICATRSCYSNNNRIANNCIERSLCFTTILIQLLLSNILLYLFLNTKTKSHLSKTTYYFGKIKFVLNTCLLWSAQKFLYL